MDESRRRVIVILISNRWNSAITEYALSSGLALRKIGHKVIFVPVIGTMAETRAKSYGLDTRGLEGFGLSSAMKLRRLCKEVNPSIIFTFGGPETFLCKFVSPKHRKIFRFYGQQDEGKKSLPAFMRRHSFSHCHGIITPCDFITSEAQAATNLPVHKVTLGCDTSVFARQETMGAYLKKRPEVVILGRLDPIKGHKRLMKIMRLVLDRWDDELRKPRLHVIGQAANLSESDIVQYANEANLKIDDDVIISARRVTPIAKYLSEAVLGIIPSLGSEVICRVAEEFLLCGAPVVVSGVGALDEVLFEGAGESYKDLNDELAADIVSIWIKRSLSEGEVEKRRRASHARTLFSLETMGASLNALF